MSKRTSRKSRRPPPQSPPSFPETAHNFLPGVTPSEPDWNPYPFETLTTPYLKRDFEKKQARLKRLRADFPEVVPEHRTSARQPPGPFMPAMEMGVLIYYLDLARVELIKRGVKLPPRNRLFPVAQARGENGINASSATSGKSLKQGRGRPVEGMVSMRRTIVGRYPNYTALALCKELDDQRVPLPQSKAGWQPNQTWTSAYKTGSRGRIDKMISTDRKAHRKPQR
jgi:hypothetical protein